MIGLQRFLSSDSNVSDITILLLILVMCIYESLTLNLIIPVIHIIDSKAKVISWRYDLFCIVIEII